jgi:trehalose 6-phosphate phosphatase
VDALAALRTSPATTALFLDFDGTLAPIVLRAEDARPLPGVPELLLALRQEYGVVAIVSGRPVAYLSQFMPTDLEVHGLYGLESIVDGVLVHHPGALAWRSVIDEVAAEAEALGPAGVDIEHKGLSLTLHFRRRPDAADPAQVWGIAAAERSGLHLRSAKKSLELHPPLQVDKGTVVAARAAAMTAVAYVGDDVGDLPAFAALDHLAATGCTTVKVAVRTPDASPAVLDQADLLVNGPEGAVALLRGLL